MEVISEHFSLLPILAACLLHSVVLSAVGYLTIAPSTKGLRALLGPSRGKWNMSSTTLTSHLLLLAKSPALLFAGTGRVFIPNHWPVSNCVIAVRLPPCLLHYPPAGSILVLNYGVALLLNVCSVPPKRWLHFTGGHSRVLHSIVVCNWTA